jgi:hypothetical protein
VISGDEGFFLVQNPLLGVEELAVGEFGLTPNPATSTVTISSTNEAITQVTIYNVLGQLVLDKTFSSNFSETLNIADLTSGLYLVKINNDTTKRLVVN